MSPTIKITINDGRKLFAITQEFNHSFPDLKIEFFAKPHTKNGAAAKKIIKNKAKKVSDCRTIHTEGQIELNPQMTVCELENIFRDEFGLSIQIFCKSGRKWLEIAATDIWTLEKQNGHCEVWSKLDVLK